MEKLYNNPAWRRIRGLRGFGILALSVAFCLTGLLALSSCDLEFWEDDDGEAAPEAMEMRGFFTSADENGDTVCSFEDTNVFLEGDEATGKLDVKMVGGSDQFDAKFGHVGIKLINDMGDKTIVTAYASQSDDDQENYVHPGSYYLASTTDSDIAGGETIFAGYWVGHLYRGDNHVVLCPYVLVPRSMSDKEDCGGMTTTVDGVESTTNGMDADMVHEGLQKYLTQEDGDSGLELRACYSVFDDDGFVSPTQD